MKGLTTVLASASKYHMEKIVRIEAERYLSNPKRVEMKMKRMKQAYLWIDPAPPY